MVVTSFNLADIEYFLLVLARITAFLFVAPFFGQQGVPAMTKIGIGCIISIMIVQSVAPEEAVYESAIGYGLIVIKEVVCGLIIGFAANICSHIVTYAGNLIDMDIGLSMASQFDPALNAQITITGNIYYYFVMLLLLLSNVHQYLIRALTDTYTLMPLGGQVFHTDTLLAAIVSYMINLFILAFRIMLPIFATMLVVNVVLGIMAKVAPQMNMFSVGIQIKVMIGVIVLFLMVFLFPQVVDMIAGEMRIIIADMVGGLH